MWQTGREVCNVMYGSRDGSLIIESCDGMIFDGDSTVWINNFIRILVLRIVARRLAFSTVANYESQSKEVR